MKDIRTSFDHPLNIACRICEASTAAACWKDDQRFEIYGFWPSAPPQEMTGAAIALPWPCPPVVDVADMKVMMVPPCPSLAATNSLAAYWPSNWMLAVWTLSVTVSVPLRLLAASVKLR